MSSSHQQIADLLQLGIIPLRHHQSDWEIGQRLVAFGIVAERSDDGRRVLREEGGLLENRGDLQSYVLWAHAGPNARPISSLSPAFSAILDGAPAGPPAPGVGQPPPATRGRPAGGNSLRPARDVNKPDGRYVSKTAQFATSIPGFGGLPAPWSGHVSSAMEEYRQVELFHPDWLNAIIAVNKAGEPTLGTQVFDLDGQSKLDPVRWARLQSLLTVLDLTPGAPACSLTGRALAINLGRGGNLDGGAGQFVLVDHDKGEIGSMSTIGGGPILLGQGCQHRQGKDKDGRGIFPAHLTTNVLFNDGAGRDAPQFFTRDQWKEPDGEESGLWRRVHLRFNPIGVHRNGCAQGSGYWMWQVRMPVIPGPPFIEDRFPPRREPPEDEDLISIPGTPSRPATGTPVDEEADLFGPGVGGELGPPPGEEDDEDPDDFDVIDLAAGPITVDGSFGEPDEEEDDPAISLPGVDGIRVEDLLPDTLEEDDEEPDGGKHIEDGTVDGEPPKGGQEGSYNPIYNHSVNCSAQPGTAFYGQPSAKEEIAVGGGLFDEETTKKILQALPLIGGLIGVAQGSGLLSNTPATSGQGAVVATGPGASIQNQAAGDHDPCQNGSPIDNPLSFLFPGGLASLFFSHLKPSNPNLATGGAVIQQTEDGAGLGIFPVDKDGNVDTANGLEVKDSGVYVNGSPIGGGGSTVDQYHLEQAFGTGYLPS